jgi:hypothetical protein
VVEEIDHHARITHNITVNKATAVPSLKRLSHLKSIVNLLGAHIDLNIDRTATGSVADIIDPNKKHTRKGTCSQNNGSKKNIPDAIIREEIINQKIAKEEILFLFLKRCL